MAELPASTVATPVSVTLSVSQPDAYVDWCRHFFASDALDAPTSAVRILCRTLTASTASRAAAWLRVINYRRTATINKPFNATANRNRRGRCFGWWWLVKKQWVTAICTQHWWLLIVFDRASSIRCNLQRCQICVRSIRTTITLGSVCGVYVAEGCCSEGFNGSRFLSGGLCPAG